MRGFGLFRSARTYSALTLHRAALPKVYLNNSGIRELGNLHKFSCPVGINYIHSTNTHFQASRDQQSIQTSTIDKDTASLSIWNHLKDVRLAPVPALTLGLAGLLPFVSIPAYFSMSGVFSPTLAFAQAAYGASILSFLGGVRWGFSVAPASVNWQDLGYSVTPSLIAWTALLLPLKLSIFTVAGGLMFAAYSDVTMQGYTSWFKGLRLLLTFVAVISLLITLKYSFFQKEDPCANQKGSTKLSEK